MFTWVKSLLVGIKDFFASVLKWLVDGLSEFIVDTITWVVAMLWSWLPDGWTGPITSVTDLQNAYIKAYGEYAADMAWFFPIGFMMTAAAVTYSIVGGVRLTRWIVALMPIPLIKTP